MKQHSLACDFPEGCTCGAAEWNALEDERNRTVAFANRIERENTNSVRLCDTQLRRISEMPLGKSIHENLADAVARLLDQRHQLAATLRAHHEWHQCQTEEDEHGIVPAEAYAESALCDQTIDALRAAS